jgi:hypothetical protein
MRLGDENHSPRKASFDCAQGRLRYTKEFQLLYFLDLYFVNLRALCGLRFCRC